MVIDVKEGEMGVLFLGHKEERVEHVEELGHVEQPGHVQGPEGLGVVRVVNGLTGPVVVASDVESTYKTFKQMPVLSTQHSHTSSPRKSPKS